MLVAVLSQDTSPLELTTSVAQGVSARSSPEAICSEPPPSLDDDEVATIVVDSDHQPHMRDDLYASSHPPQQGLAQQQQKLFDLNQLTEEEKLVLSTSGSARLYQANSQDEIDAIMQQVLDSKTTDTILIVSPVGRQIVTCNENGDQIITRVMTTDPNQRPPGPDGGERMGFHGQSPENHHIPDYACQTGHQHQQAMQRQTVYSSTHSDLDGSPPQSVIYEKHLTAGQIEMLSEQGLRKTGRDMQGLYTEQAIHEHQQQQHLVYDSNNNADNDSAHDQLEGQRAMKSSRSNDDDSCGAQGEVLGDMIDDKPQIDLMYNDGSKTVIYTAAAPTASGGVGDEEGQHKPMGMYTTSADDMDTFIESGGHQMVVQQQQPFEGDAQGSSAVYVVQGMVHEEEAMDLHSGLR